VTAGKRARDVETRRGTQAIILSVILAISTSKRYTNKQVPCPLPPSSPTRASWKLLKRSCPDASTVSSVKSGRSYQFPRHFSLSRLSVCASATRARGQKNRERESRASERFASMHGECDRLSPCPRLILVTPDYLLTGHQQPVRAATAFARINI